MQFDSVLSIMHPSLLAVAESYVLLVTLQLPRQYSACPVTRAVACTSGAVFFEVNDNMLRSTRTHVRFGMFPAKCHDLQAHHVRNCELCASQPHASCTGSCAH
jgi:hypothetical protein